MEQIAVWQVEIVPDAALSSRHVRGTCPDLDMKLKKSKWPEIKYYFKG
jgi:hypothetical protein